MYVKKRTVYGLVSVLMTIILLLGTLVPVAAEVTVSEKNPNKAALASTVTTVYFKNTENWSTVNAYVWVKGTTNNAQAWPGQAMTYCNNDIYKYEFTGEYSMIIFNNGSIQTGDLSIPGNRQIYDYSKNSWSEFTGDDTIITPVSKSFATVNFGRYYQTKVTNLIELNAINNNGVDDSGKATVNGEKYIRKDGEYYRADPLEWRIIGQENGNYILMTENVICERQFSGGQDFWSTCGLRGWLNSEFMNDAFTTTEQSEIALSKIANVESGYENKPGGGEEYIEYTEDYVYLLTKDEIEGLYTNSERVAYATEYANSNKSQMRYWLRGPKLWTYGLKRSYYVDPDGSIGSWYATYSYGVRPVIKVRKTSSLAYRIDQQLGHNRFNVYQNEKTSDKDNQKYVVADNTVVSYGNVDYKTDKNGIVNIKDFESGSVTFEKEGFIKRTLTSEQLENSHSVYLEQKNDNAPVIYAVWVGNDDVLHNPYPLSMTSKEKTTIVAEIDWGKSSYSSVYLTQDGKTESFKGNAITTVISEKFDTSEPIKMVATDSEGHSTKRTLLIQNGMVDSVVKDLEGASFSFTDKISVKIPDSYDVIGGMSISAGVSTLVPVTVIAEKGKIYAAIGVELVSYEKDSWKTKGETKKFIENLKETGVIDASGVAGNIKKLANLENTYKEHIKKPKGSFGVEGDFTILGFAEGTYDENGKIVWLDGGVIAKPSIGIHKDFPFTLGPVPMYFEIGFSAEIMAQLNIRFNEQAKNFIPNGEISGEVSLNGGIGVGIKKVLYAGGGLEGSLLPDWKINIGKNDYFKLDAQLKAYAKVGVVGFEGKKNFEIGKTTLLEFPSSASIATVGACEDFSFYDTSNYSVKDLSYLDNESLFINNYNESDLAMVSASHSYYDSMVLKTNIYRESTPKLLELDNGNKIVIWTDASSNDINEICLYYSYYNGSSWSNPQKIHSDGTMDYNPYVYKLGNQVYVAWQNATKRFENPNDLSLDEIAGDFDISIATLKADYSFSCVTIENKNLDMQPVVYADTEKVYLVWVNNSDNDWFGNNNKNSIMICTLSDGQLSSQKALYSDLNSIDSVAVDYDNALNIAYCMDVDGDINTSGDVRVYENGSLVRDGEYFESNPQYINHELWWYTQNNIVNKDTELIETGNILSDRYELVMTNDGLVSVYTQGKGLYSSLCGCYFNSESNTWGDPITFVDNNTFIGAFYANTNSEGKLEFIINEASVLGSFGDDDPYGSSQLILLVQNEYTDLSISDPMYDASSYCVGKSMIFNFEVTNNGSKTIDNFIVDVLDENGKLLSTYEVDEQIVPGQTIAVDTQYVFPDSKAYQTVSISVSTPNTSDIDMNNNIKTMVFGYENICVDNITSAMNEDDKTIISADIINYGYESTNDVTVYLKKDSKNGQVVASTKISGIESMDLKTVSFTIDAENGAVYYVVVECSDLEYFADNSDFVVIQKTEDSYILGDVDGDGEVTVLDATSIQKYLTGKNQLLEEAMKAADTDKDGIVAVMDATKIQRFIAKIITEF